MLFSCPALMHMYFHLTSKSLRAAAVSGCFRSLVMDLAAASASLCSLSPWFSSPALFRRASESLAATGNASSSTIVARPPSCSPSLSALLVSTSSQLSLSLPLCLGSVFLFFLLNKSWCECVWCNCSCTKSSQSTEMHRVNIPKVGMDGLKIFAVWQTANKDITMRVAGCVWDPQCQAGNGFNSQE